MPSNNALAKEKAQVIATLSGEGFLTELKAGKHQQLADEPEDVGGEDQGPSPYDYLLSALGSCTAMTINMYVRRKGWKLDKVIVYLAHAKSHKEDCQNCDNDNAKLDTIHRVIEINGDLDDDQRKRILGIANKCPVHRTLNSDIRINTALLKP